ncbi:MAG: DUF1997 domain-containing protein [Cyanobacteriota bacterium]
MSIASSKPVVPVSDGQDNQEVLQSQYLAKAHLELKTTRRGQVDLETDQETLAHYLRGHSQWIQHCFCPLQVEALSADSYKLQFFRMGGLGFELEPCFGVKIWPDENHGFRLTSIELPSDAAMPYRVNCQATFRLEELSRSPEGESPQTTRVHWDLHLEIKLSLPGFLQVLPHNLVRRVANQVVQQVTRSMSDRLTHNICSDFYRSIDRPGCPYRRVSLD